MGGTLKDYFVVTHARTYRLKKDGPPKREPAQRTLDQLLPVIHLRPSPILSLPLEVLCEIFSYIIHTTTHIRRHCDPLRLPDSEDVDDEAPTTVDLTACPAERRFRDGCSKYCSYGGVWNHLEIMRVCKRFYATALAYAPWWQNVMLFNPSIARMCLERSKIDPLYVDYAEGYPFLRDPAPRPNVKALSLVLEQGMPRIRELTLQIDNAANMQHMFTHCKSLAAPLLVKLDLLFPFNGVARPMPALFDPEMPPPRLRSLRLLYVDMREASFMFTTSITSVEMSDCHGPWESMEDIIGILTNLPSLEHLSLSGGETFPEAMSQPFLSSTSGNRLASSLQDLELTADVATITNFLECFCFPVSTSLSLDFHHHEGIPHNVQRLLDFFTRHYGTMTEDKPSFARATVYLDYHTEKCFRLELARDDSTPSTLPKQLHIEHTWRDATWFEPVVVEGLAHAIHEHIPLHGVRQLRISELGKAEDLGLEDALPQTFWWRSFARMRDLRALCLEAEPTDFCEWMDHQEGEDAAVFPLLAKLTLNDVNLEQALTVLQSDSESDPEEETPFDAHAGVLDIEAESDAPSPSVAALARHGPKKDGAQPSDKIRLRDIVDWRMHWQAKNGKLPFTLQMYGCKVGKIALRDLLEEMADIGVTVDWREEIEDADYDEYDI